MGRAGAIVVAAALLVIGAACAGDGGDQGPCAANDGFFGSPLEPLEAAPDFTLTDQNGADFTLSAQRGVIVLLFFGYASCPDICPLTLSEFARVADALGDRATERVRFVFITVDPDRDSAEDVGRYVARFDPSFVGLRGTVEELAVVLAGYGIYARADGSLVDHTSSVILVDGDGHWRLIYGPGAPASEIETDIRRLMG